MRLGSFIARRDIYDKIAESAEHLVSIQCSDPRKLAYGGFQSKNGSTYYYSVDAMRTISTLLKAHNLTGNATYFNAAKLAGKNVLYNMQQQPSNRLKLVVQFSIYLLFELAAIEIAHHVVLRSWNVKVFAAFSGLAGTILRVLLERKGLWKSRKIFSENKPKTASVLSHKLANKSLRIQKPPIKHLRVRIAFTVKPDKIRAECIELLDKIIKRVDNA